MRTKRAQSEEEDLGLSWSPGHVRLAPPTEFSSLLKAAFSHFTPAGSCSQLKV